MKKLLVVLGALLIVGGGCLSLGKGGGQKTVEGDWYLTFSLPVGWLTLAPYQEPDTKAVDTVKTITRDLNEIFLQTSDKPIVSAGAAPEVDVPAESYVSINEHTQVRVSRLDPRRVVPSEAESLGDDFYKLMLCEDGGDCQLSGRYNYDYYLKTDDANYKFIVYGQDITAAEKIILSSKLVTLDSQE
ncbi:MAG: hypothetical protein WAZ14_01260 [Patescibacteria group bacterium]